MSSLTSRDILLQVADLTRASSFYESLGMHRFMEQPTMHGFEAGAFRLFLEEAPPLGPVFEIFVEDVRSKRAQLVASGCIVVAEDPSVPKCYIQDPFGLTFNIAER